MVVVNLNPATRATQPAAKAVKQSDPAALFTSQHCSRQSPSLSSPGAPFVGGATYPQLERAVTVVVTDA